MDMTKSFVYRIWICLFGNNCLEDEVLFINWTIAIFLAMSYHEMVNHEYMTMTVSWK